MLYAIEVLPTLFRITYLNVKPTGTDDSESVPGAVSRHVFSHALVIIETPGTIAGTPPHKKKINRQERLEGSEHERRLAPPELHDGPAGSDGHVGGKKGHWCRGGEAPQAC